jgi:hypothetical protein
MVNIHGMVFTIIKVKESIKTVAVSGSKKESIEQRKQINIFITLKHNIEIFAYWL